MLSMTEQLNTKLMVQLIGCVVEDEKVCVDDVIDLIQESEEDVIQGVDIRNHGCGI
eukprot:403352219